jgi:hypothetical protein
MQNVQWNQTQDCPGKSAIQQVDFLSPANWTYLKTKMKQFYIWSITLYGAKTSILRIQIRNALKVLKCGAGEGWSSVKLIVWKNEQVLNIVKEKRHVLHKIKKQGYLDWPHLGLNCLLKHVTEEHIEGNMKRTTRRGRRRNQLLDDIKENKRYGNSKQEALDSTVWCTGAGRGYRPVARQTTKWINEWTNERVN